MLQNNKASRDKGFTLVEMLVIAPVALLVITGFIAVMVTMVGDIIAGRAHNIMTYDIQSALNTIEQDVKLSTQFLVSSGTMISPQGKDGNTSAFASTSGDLILGEIATDKNPIDPTRGFIYYNAPFSCGSPTEVYKNRIFFMTVVYFVRDNSLWRRTYVPTASGTLCQQPWQVNTCAPGYSGGATQCQATDSEVLRGVDSFDVSYYTNPEDTVAISPASATSASSIRVSLSGETLAAGRTVTASNSNRSTKLSEKDVALAPPASPTVTGSSSGMEAVFSWPSVPNATSYIVRYNINGGSWITATENTIETLFSVPASRGDTVSVKVFARNTTGASLDIASNNASVTIPLWIDCALQNSWVTYNAWYESCGFTITKGGVVMLKGHIRSGSLAADVGLFRLPPAFRPSEKLMFQNVISPHVSTRIDVNTDGWVRLASGSSSDYVGLDGIYFLPSSSLYRWTSLTLTNGWTAYGNGFPTLQTTQDTIGRVHLRGVVQQGTYANETGIATLPAGSIPSEYYHLPARGSAYNYMGIHPAGAIVAKGISSTYYSTQAMFYPSTFSGWQSISGTVSGNPADNQLGNNWTAYSAPYTQPAYTRSADGVVTLKGLIHSGTTTDNTFMARLPGGYCPFTDKTLAFSTTSASGVARIDVARISGQDSCYIIYRNGSSGWMSLDNISYMAE